MSKMNLLVDLRVFDGLNVGSSDNSSIKTITWQGFDIEENYVREVVIPSKSMRTLFSDLNTSFTIGGGEQNLAITPVAGQETVTIQSEEDKNFILISQRILPKSLILSVGRLLAFSGIDYEVEIVENGTKITWINSFADGGAEAIEIGDTVNLFYNFTQQPLTVEELNSGILFDRYKEDYSLVYIESSDCCRIVLNNIVEGDINPVVINGTKRPGYFLKSTRIDDI